MRALTQINELFRQLIFLPLLPIILFQAKQVRRKAIHLPLAKGKHQAIQANAELSLLHIGESTVAGVGVSHLKFGLTNAISKHLNLSLGVNINWHILAQNGATIAHINQLESTIPNPDILLITLGVNDTTGITSIRAWRDQIYLSCQKFAGPETQIYFTQVPNMAQFPLLPFPLNRFLGIRSQQLDDELKACCHLLEAHYLNSQLPIKAAWMAKDGYHPNEAGYDIWAEQIASSMAPTLKFIKP